MRHLYTHYELNDTIWKQLFDLEVKGQGTTKVIMVRDTPLMFKHPHTKYHWPIWKDKNTIQKSIICLWDQSPKNVITVWDTPPYSHAPTYQI
jgi:hypothetical protein